MDENSPTAQGASLPVSLPFRAVLTPHRSLPPQGFLILMALLTAVSFVTGLAFALMGAWPVFGFFGLDVALVYLAFKLNYRAARAREIVDVTRDTLVVTRVSADGRRRSVARFNPSWANLDTREAPDGSVDLVLGMHGRTMRLARDLGSDERREFARALRAALQLVKRAELR